MVCTHIHTHTHTMEYYLAIKKSEIMSFAATWMDLEIIELSEVIQTEKDKYHMISLICGMVQMSLFTKQKLSHRCRKQTCAYQGGSGRQINWEIEVDIYTLLYIE